ncbi:MAG TPA: undecaprenyl-diphosphate phosphatase [Euzebya sp.]|nr:undecaprenyl-diphosphate phosphatase [Euzebya sp.]
MIPPWLEAMILGIVQGLTEFIPVSSSGHLVLVPYLSGWEDRSLAFDVLLHVGTLGAVVLYFRHELLAIGNGILQRDTSEEGRVYRRVGLLILPASMPVAAAGWAFEDQVAEVFESPLITSLLLLVTAALLLALEAVRSGRVRRAAARDVAGIVDRPVEDADTPDPGWGGDWRARDEHAVQVDEVTRASLPTGVDVGDPLGASLAGLTLRQAMIAGLFQCLAILPGVSRAGSTIAGGVFSGLTREAATRFSFLLVIPVLVGATALSLPDLAEGGDTATELIAGVLAAFASGYVAIRFLVRLVSRERLTGFAYYCIAASIVGLIGHAMLGPASTV